MSRKRIFVTVTLLVVLGGAAAAAWMILRGADGQSRSESAVRYHCPMHPTMVSDRPGECPICHMSLVPMEEEPAPAAGEPADHAPSSEVRKRIIYRSTMNPGEVSDAPGKDSMGMEMVAEEIVEGEPQASTVPGLATVRIPMQKQQLIGVKTALVTRAPFLRTIRAVGRVTYDETRLHHVHTKIAGYVEKLYANATGETVRSGQPLLEIYSPELLASQQEYLVALRARARTADSTLPSVAGSGEQLLESARRRLELYDVTDEQIGELERTGQARRNITLDAPISGTILQRMVAQGERVEPEMTLLDIADLSRVWVVAAVYEYELPFVYQGQEATMSLSYLPGRAFEGRVSLVYPVLDAATRTAQVRLEFDNPGLLLKPDMFADVELSADLGERLAVPDTAVMDTGTRSVVFVDKGDGFFEPREVRIGLRLPDHYEILDGLTEGERVLTSANFYVDSESKLKAALAAMDEAPGGAGEKVPSPGHQH
jgi:RND family efflux transporter MFP subunit